MKLMKTVLKFTDNIIQVVIAYHQKYDWHYYLKDDQVNECKYWRGYDKGIWFSCNHWCIGKDEDKGTEKCYFKAPGSRDQLPTELQGKWLYWNPDSKEWIKAGNDITLKFQDELPYNESSIE